MDSSAQGEVVPILKLVPLKKESFEKLLTGYRLPPIDVNLTDEDVAVSIMLDGIIRLPPVFRINGKAGDEGSIVTVSPSGTLLMFVTF